MVLIVDVTIKQLVNLSLNTPFQVVILYLLEEENLVRGQVVETQLPHIFI